MKVKKLFASLLAMAMVVTLNAPVLASDSSDMPGETSSSSSVMEQSAENDPANDLAIEIPQVESVEEGVDVDLTLLNSGTDGLEAGEVIDTAFTISEEPVGKYTPSLSRAVYQTSDKRIKHDDYLTPSNPMNLYLFSTNRETFLFFGGLSSSANVIAELYLHDPSTDNLFQTGLIVDSNQYLQYNKLPAGNYCLAIYTATTPTSNISVRTLANFALDYNASIAANNMSLSKDFAYVKYYIGSKCYVNTRYISDIGDHNTHLTYQYNSGDSVNHYMSVTEPYIKSVSVPISFQSTSGASSPAAVLVYMGKKTAYCYKRSSLNYVPGGVSGTNVSFVDFRMDLITPRLFDWYDVDPPRDQVLVVDIATGKVIDFVGSANYFYHTGAYQATMTII